MDCYKDLLPTLYSSTRKYSPKRWIYDGLPGIVGASCAMSNQAVIGLEC